jgi:hypothetical protein
LEREFVAGLLFAQYWGNINEIGLAAVQPHQSAGHPAAALTALSE